ncbi:hypothetical protein FBY03_102221 [Pseudomonas sp. SJZ079]|nr:hypothetical protein FBY03_102221 [Pseudomonas sp. SJZ079]
MDRQSLNPHTYIYLYIQAYASRGPFLFSSPTNSRLAPRTSRIIDLAHWRRTTGRLHPPGAELLPGNKNRLLAEHSRSTGVALSNTRANCRDPLTRRRRRPCTRRDEASAGAAQAAGRGRATTVAAPDFNMRGCSRMDDMGRRCQRLRWQPQVVRGFKGGISPSGQAGRYASSVRQGPCAAALAGRRSLSQVD